MENIVKTIQKASADWDTNHNNDAFVDALIEFEKTTYNVKMERLKEIFERDKHDVMNRVFSATKTSLNHFSPNKPVPWKANNVEHDWQAMLTCVKTASSYFTEALFVALHNIDVDYKIKIPPEIEHNYGMKCNGDNCWYASNCDRGEAHVFFFNVIDQNVYCDMCYKNYNFSSGDVEGLTEEFINFLEFTG